MPASLSSEGSTFSTASTQPYLPGQGGLKVDPWVKSRYHATMPEILDWNSIRPREVTHATRKANPAFYNPQGVDVERTFNKSMLPNRKEAGRRLSRMFGAPQVGFNSSTDARYFYHSEEPEVQYTLKAKPAARGTDSYTSSDTTRRNHEPSAPRYDDHRTTPRDDNYRTTDKPGRPSIRQSRKNSQYGYIPPLDIYEDPRSAPSRKPRLEDGDYYKRRRPVIPERRQSKQDYRRKSSVHHYDDATAADNPPKLRAALRPLTHSRQNSAAGLQTTSGRPYDEEPATYKTYNPRQYVSYAVKPAKQEQPQSRVITVPSAWNEAYRNRKLPRGTPGTAQYKEDFWQLNGFEYDHHLAWYKYHWPKQ